MSFLLEKLHVLPVRKLKFSTKVYYDQNDETLVRNLKKKFGLDAILVLGNWSAPNAKFHEPTRNKGLIRMLKKNGLTVHLIDEFKTFSKCSNCEDDLETFKTVINPHPYRRVDMLTVKCHGLLRYMIVVIVTIEFVMTITTELLGVKTPNVLPINLEENYGTETLPWS
ncbi:hypothetical protein CU097_002788 [Rhizopus azygosporus]|uniref:Uncharacterized protein n=1 Tax=Rhizopus azygosporus TaxID=86630 RepID=A0A367J4F1_RHIAZ|nr:hypothetical protein CU097_002788 [Rhizopus azygosporus]